MSWEVGGGETDWIFISYGRLNKWPQTRWLKIMEIHFLTVLETRSPKPGY